MPRVKTRYFGRVRELLGVKAEEYEVEDGATVADLLLVHIPQRHKEESEAWKRTIFRTAKGKLLMNKDGTPLLRNHLILVDGKTSNLSQRLRDGDEIAVLPPFGGG
jgi:molybdopterin converting factor small subunit